jgi:hypothetical protein
MSAHSNGVGSESEHTKLPIDAVWRGSACTGPRQTHVWVPRRRTDHVISGLQREVLTARVGDIKPHSQTAMRIKLLTQTKTTW